MSKINSQLLLEFSRYLIVGGSAFIIDFLVMCTCNEFIFAGKHVFISVFIGYMVGLVYNFLLSCGFVFKGGFEKIKNKEILSFVIFTVIGLIGLALTELFMYVFVNIFIIHYFIAKIMTGAIVVFWNYIARKLVIYK